MAPNEAVVAIGLEVRIADNTGMINIGVPSLVIKMLRQKFDQQWSRKTESKLDEQERVLRLLQTSRIDLDARLQGPTVRVEDLMGLEPGDVLRFDYAIDKPIDLLTNGKLKFHGHVAAAHNGRAFLVE
jgi:flagellar motor switch protein FliM